MFLRKLIYWPIAFSLLACNASDQTQPVQHDTTTWSPQLVTSLPSRLRTTTAVDPANIRAIATVAGAQTELQLNDAGQYIGQIAVPASADITVTINFIETFEGQDLTLASTSRNMRTGASEATLTLQQSDYAIDIHDADGDNTSNLQEREAGTNPLDSNEQPGRTRVQVFALSPLRTTLNLYRNYQFRVTVGSEVFETEVGALTFNHTFSVVQQSPLTIDISVIESETGQQLTIAKQTRVIDNVQSLHTVNIPATGYNFAFDQDNDGVVNLDELTAGTDPLVSDTQMCTPVTEDVTFSLTDDAYLQSSGTLKNGTPLRVEHEERVALVRFQADDLPGTVTNAELVLVGGDDEGSGLISIYALPDFEWNDVSGSLTLPALGNPVAQLDEDWEEDEEYYFDLQPSSITQDITVVIRQDSDDNDLAFDSSDGFNPPALHVTVERCE